MGEVRIKVRIGGLSPEGELSGATVEADAVVDTGAAKTVISRTMARRAKVPMLGMDGYVAGIVGGESVPLGLAAVLAPTCELTPLVVAVMSDEAMARAGAQVVLGHDHMQAVRMVVAPHRREAVCEVDEGLKGPTKRRRKGSPRAGSKGGAAVRAAGALGRTGAR